MCLKRISLFQRIRPAIKMTSQFALWTLTSWGCSEKSGIAKHKALIKKLLVSSTNLLFLFITFMFSLFSLTPSSHPPSINIFIAYSLYCCNEQSSMHHWVVLPFSGKQITTQSALENTLPANRSTNAHSFAWIFIQNRYIHISHTHTYALEKKHYGWY